jgi:plastocyanin
MKRTGVWFLGATSAATLLFSASASAATRTVYAGSPNKLTQKIAAKLIPNLKSFSGKYNPDINSFFNQKLTIHTGDTVSFQIEGFHTIDLPDSSKSALPLILPNGTTTGVNDAAGNPFWFNGLPSLGVNPALAGHQGPSTYDGTTRIDSGVPLGPPKPMKVKFSKPGVYKYFCDVHPGMIGTVVVKPKGKKIPSAKQVHKALVSQITGDVKVAKRLAKSKPASNTVSLGESAKDGVELFTMFPQTLKVKANTTVTFTMSKASREVHTATFGPTTVLKTLSDGFQGINFPSQGLYPSDPASIVVSPTSHGDGFGNTGALDTDSATPTINPSNKINFTTPGTYHFECLIHPFMQGTIVVQ